MDNDSAVRGSRQRGALRSANLIGRWSSAVLICKSGHCAQQVAGENGKARAANTVHAVFHQLY